MSLQLFDMYSGSRSYRARRRASRLVVTQLEQNVIGHIIHAIHIPIPRRFLLLLLLVRGSASCAAWPKLGVTYSKSSKRERRRRRAAEIQYGGVASPGVVCMFRGWQAPEQAQQHNGTGHLRQQQQQQQYAPQQHADAQADVAALSQYLTSLLLGAGGGV